MDNCLCVRMFRGISSNFTQRIVFAFNSSKYVNICVQLWHDTWLQQKMICVALTARRQIRGGCHIISLTATILIQNFRNSCFGIIYDSNFSMVDHLKVLTSVNEFAFIQLTSKYGKYVIVHKIWCDFVQLKKGFIPFFLLIQRVDFNSVHHQFHQFDAK